MENKNLPAYPRPKQIMGSGEDYHEIPAADGLSKRELMAGMALQGLLANPNYNCPSKAKDLPTVDNFAKAALHYADALLSQLENHQP